MSKKKMVMEEEPANCLSLPGEFGEISLDLESLVTSIPTAPESSAPVNSPGSARAPASSAPASSAPASSAPAPHHCEQSALPSSFRLRTCWRGTGWELGLPISQQSPGKSQR